MKRACPDCGAHVWQRDTAGPVECITYACGSLFDTDRDGGTFRHRSTGCHLRELRHALEDFAVTLLTEIDRTVRGVCRAIHRRNRA